jgi:uncharacterized protein with HEPN domain
MGFRIEDILECIGKIESYTEGMDFRAFTDSNITIDVVLRNIEIIGEAANHIPDEVAALEKDIPWQQIREMRNILAHEYFGADLETVWVTVTENIPPLVEPLERLLKRKGS